MKKLLIATAALAMVAGTAQAQSSVTVYGIIDTGYNSLKDKNGATTTDRAAVQGSSSSNAGEASSSRLGFRGTEDLGGGLKATFNVEGGMGQGSAFTFGRAYNVGLEDAKLGTVRVGLQDTLNRSAWLAHDQLAAANVAGNLAHNDNGSGAAGGSSFASHTARNVAINYLSPRFSGVQLVLGMTQNDSEKTGDKKQKTGSGSQVGLNYVQGKFAANLAYAEAKTDTNAVSASGIYAGNAQTSATNLGDVRVDAASIKNKETSAGASYDFGMAKVGYVYHKRDSANASDAAATSNLDRTSHSFSASIPLNAKLVARVGYGFGEVRQGAASNINADMKGYQAALNYNLSKRTTVYGIYGNEKRDLTTSTDYESKEYSVGVRHSF
ncbi:MAG: porin [Pseudomonadota bacterium]|jgi:predicted porin